MRWFSLPLLVLLLPAPAPAEPIPGTKPLEMQGNLAAQMVDGIHKYLDRALADSARRRDELWKESLASKEALQKAIPERREHLKKILALRDERVKPSLEFHSSYGTPAVVAEIAGCKVRAVRWAVLPGVDAEGLLIEPKTVAAALVVAIPHADQLPEELAGLIPGDDFGLRLAQQGCRVLIPTLIDRKDDLSGNPKLKRQTNLPHREFLYRMSYEMGRTLIGYEVQKVLAAVDLFKSTDPELKIGVAGYGDGGTLAMYSAAVDERISVASFGGCLSSKVKLSEEPIDRNIWGLMLEFGDAEVLLLRGDANQYSANLSGPKWNGPTTRPGRSGAAPGKIAYDTSEGNKEFQRFRLKRDPNSPVESELGGQEQVHLNLTPFLKALGIEAKPIDTVRVAQRPVVDASDRQARQFHQLVEYNQKLWRESPLVRKELWKKADASSPAAWEKSCDWYREYFHSEVIGKLPEPTMPLNPRSRQIIDEKTYTGFEVVLDVYEDVFAEGILLMPKGLAKDEKRPVVVCQHGLEGTPRSCIDQERGPTYCEFARKLVEKGYIVFCPQNPYYGNNHFRQLQRKANPLKLSLFSFIIRQHQRILDWLETQPNVDAKRIGFYGLSYGGKTAMRVPAVEKRYCLSICSGDFNEWVGKNVSIDLDRSYMWTGEYEMYEFDLGNTFNYAEMAYLIAPRPFMVERGHDDGVGIDEMVASEFARVRYLYANRLKIPDRTTIEFQPGGHQIFLKGTLEFLEKHLGKPR